MKNEAEAIGEGMIGTGTKIGRGKSVETETTTANIVLLEGIGAHLLTADGSENDETMTSATVIEASAGTRKMATKTIVVETTATTGDSPSATIEIAKDMTIRESDESRKFTKRWISYILTSIWLESPS